jgi:hypothetical protein
MGPTSNRYNFLVIFFVALGSFTYGFNSAIIGSTFGLESFFEYFDTGPHGHKGNQVISGKLSDLLCRVQD